MRQSKEQYYRRLKTTLTAAFFICGIVPVFLIAFASIHNSKQLALEEIEVTGRQIVLHREDVINNFLNHQIDLLSTLINLYDADYFTKSSQLDKLFLAINQSGHIVDLLVIRADGSQLGYVGPYRHKISGKSYSEQEWFTDVLVKGVHVSDIFTGYRNIPHFVVAVANPLKSYVVRATINSGEFNSLLHSAQTGSNSDVFLVNEKGELQTPSLQKKENLTATEKQLIRYHKGAQTVSVDETLYITSWLDSTNWQLMLKIHTPDLLNIYYAHLERTLTIVFFIITIFLLIAFFLSHFIVSQIIKVDREAAAMDQQMMHIEKLANIGRLATGVAHEINNPLQMILAQISWLEELFPDEDPKALKNYDEYTTTIDKIKHHVDRAAEITHRLLGFSRKIQAEQESVQVNDNILEALSFLEKEAENNNIKIHLDLGKKLPKIRIHANRLQQVLLNLFDNALDSVGHDGEVIIKSRAQNGTICIKVADSGPGISEETLRQIWDPFFTTKEQGKGTGLGLPISQDIIISMGGTLSVANRAEGGAEFTLTLPLL